jgi:phosphinothricin acetyltransferase
MVHDLAAHHGDVPTIDVEMLKRDALGDAPWLTVLVAERAGVLLGYAALCRMAQMQFGARGMDMHHLFVARAHRGQGVGAALITASVKAAKAQDCRFVIPGFGMIDGAFLITGLNYAGSYNGEAQFEISLASAAVPEFTAL